MQDCAIIFTLSTFSVGPPALDDGDAAAAPVLDERSLLDDVPVISTLWPTCGVSFESSPSSLYDVALLPLVPAAPGAPDDELLPDDALFSTNFAAVDAPAAPLVPVGEALAEAFSRQPVTVTLFALELELEGVCRSGAGVCAPKVTAIAQARAAAAPV